VKEREGKSSRATQKVAAGASARGTGSVSVVAAKPAVQALEQRGIDPAPALREARLLPTALGSFDNRLPHPAVAALWEAAARLAGDPWLGMHAARDLPPGSYDLFDYLLSTPATVGAGIERLVAYARLVYDHTNLRLVVEPRDARIVRRVPVPSPQFDEFSLTAIFVRCRENSGVAWRPRQVVFQHPRPDQDPGEPTRLFGCAVRFGARASEIHFDPAVLQLRQARADCHLLAVLTRYADSLLATIPAPDALVGRVRAAILRQVPRELPALDATAKALDVPERTLQRHLAAAGFSYRGLVDEARRELALRYLGNAGLSVTDVGYLLHFSEPASFHRAFRRWTGQSPLEYRRRLLGRA
jgi:AraC-like DNA-binding protein